MMMMMMTMTISVPKMSLSNARTAGGRCLIDMSAPGIQQGGPATDFPVHGSAEASHCGLM